jgi:hypothetical protein
MVESLDMKNWIRLLIPVGLGGLAFALNAWIMAQRLTPERFVRVTSDVPCGEPLELASLAPVEMFGDLGSMREVLIPWDDRALVIGATLRQSVLAGDPVLRIDVEYEDPGSPFVESVPGIGEEELTIPIRELNLTSERLTPGQMVKVIVSPLGQPAAAEGSGDEVRLSRSQQILGPFRIIRVSQGSLTVAIAAPANGGWLDEGTATLVAAAHGRRFEVLGIVTGDSDPAPAAAAPEDPGGE